MTDRPGRRTWRSRVGATASITIAAAPQQQSHDESDILETRPFLKQSSPASNSTGRGGIVAKANQLYQGVVVSLGTAATTATSNAATTTGSNSKQKRSLLHRRRGGGGKRSTDAIHVQIPQKFIYYTAAVFLVLPLTVFVWKEFHLHPPPGDSTIVNNNHKNNGDFKGHDQFPTWMDHEQQQQVAVKTGNLKGSQESGDQTTSQEEHHDSKSQQESSDDGEKKAVESKSTGQEKDNIPGAVIQTNEDQSENAQPNDTPNNETVNNMNNKLAATIEPADEEVPLLLKEQESVEQQHEEETIQDRHSERVDMSGKEDEESEKHEANTEPSDFVDKKISLEKESDEGDLLR